MNQPVSIGRFALYHIVISGLLLSAAVAFSLNSTAGFPLWLNISGVVVPAILTFGAFLFCSLQVNNARPAAFTNTILGTMMMKMLASIGFILLVLLEMEGRPVAFIAFYLISYLSLTGLEVWALLSNVNANKESPKP